MEPTPKGVDFFFPPPRRARQPLPFSRRLPRKRPQFSLLPSFLTVGYGHTWLKAPHPVRFVKLSNHRPHGVVLPKNIFLPIRFAVPFPFRIRSAFPIAAQQPCVSLPVNLVGVLMAHVRIAASRSGSTVACFSCLGGGDGERLSALLRDPSIAVCAFDPAIGQR